MGLNLGDLGLRGCKRLFNAPPFGISGEPFWRPVGFFETGILRVFFGLLFWSTDKLSHNDSQKGLPGGPQEGSRLDESSMFTFAA